LSAKIVNPKIVVKEVKNNGLTLLLTVSSNILSMDLPPAAATELNLSKSKIELLIPTPIKPKSPSCAANENGKPNAHKNKNAPIKSNGIELKINQGWRKLPK